MRRTVRGQARREAIVSATQRIIAARGSRTVNHRNVATEAGVPLAATTYYFASKEDLIVEAFTLAARSAVTNIRREMPKLLSARSATGLAAALASYYAQQLDTDRSALRTLYELYIESGRNAALRSAVDEWNAASMEVASTIVEAAGSGSVEADAHLLILVIDGLVLEQLNTPGPRLAEALREPLVRILLMIEADGNAERQD